MSPSSFCLSGVKECKQFPLAEQELANTNMEKKYPIGGYAPGNYQCNCTTCNTNFQGDKRAVQCEDCAVNSLREMLKPYDTTDSETLTIDDYEAVLADQRRLVRELDVIINGENAAKQASLVDMVCQIRDLWPRQGIGWVKGVKGFPIRKKVIAKFKHYDDPLRDWVIGTASSATGDMICFDWHVSSIVLDINHERWNMLEWLDEGQPQPVEE
jgi:hypothetical protein